jgi:hypothetical protein
MTKWTRGAKRVIEVAPVVALDPGDTEKVLVTFQAFHSMSAMEREALTPLTETELTQIPGLP